MNQRIKQFIKHSLPVGAAVALSICLVQFHCQCTAGEIYSFRDENGVYHYSNVPNDPRYSAGYRERKKLKVSRRKAAHTRNKSAGSRLDSPEIAETVSVEAARRGLDPALVKAIIEVESGGRSDARSPKGAVGLMQLMPGTASDMGVRDRTDYQQNIKGGTGYLSSLIERFDGNIVLALAAYNAGPSAVEKYRGLPPYLETVRYVRKVLEAWNRYRVSDRKRN